jgi:DNA-binding CsgD family transcriptional regulator
MDPASPAFTAYSAVVRALGGQAMDRALLSAADSLAPVDEIFAFHRFASDQPQPILSAGAVPGREQRAQLYSAGFYGSDPTAAALVRRRASGFVAQRVSAEQIEEPAYRARCYDEPGLAEKVTVAMRDRQCVTVLNFYRGRRRPLLGERGVARLVRFAEFALPLVRRHAELAPSETGGGRGLAQLEQKLTELDASLTPRERGVVARTLIGRTSQQISAELRIAASSVLTYRRRAYARLRISSSAELVLALAG